MKLREKIVDFIKECEDHDSELFVTVSYDNKKLVDYTLCLDDISFDEDESKTKLVIENFSTLPTIVVPDTIIVVYDDVQSCECEDKTDEYKSTIAKELLIKYKNNIVLTIGFCC